MSEFVTYLVTGIALGSSFALIGSGFVVVHRVTRVVNFAQGSLAVRRRRCCPPRCWPADCRTWSGRGAWPSWSAALVGLLVGFIAIGKPRHTTPDLADRHPRRLDADLRRDHLAVGPGPRVATRPRRVRDDPRCRGGAAAPARSLVATLVAFAALVLFFSRTYLGKALTASASNPFAARMVGIDVRRMGLARLRARRDARRAGGRAARTDQRTVLLLRPAAGAQRVRCSRLRRAGQPAAHPGRRPRARRRRPADRGLPQWVLPDRGGPAADDGHHDRAEQHASRTRRRSDVPSDVPRDVASPAQDRHGGPGLRGRSALPRW